MYAYRFLLLFRFYSAHPPKGYFPVSAYQLRSLFVFLPSQAIYRVATFSRSRFRTENPLLASFLSLSRCLPSPTTMARTSILSSSLRSPSKQAPTHSTLPTFSFHPPLHSKEYRTHDSITITEAENPAEPIGSLPLGSPFPRF